jgi:hypothetical protein
MDWSFVRWTGASCDGLELRTMDWSFVQWTGASCDGLAMDWRFLPTTLPVLFTLPPEDASSAANIFEEKPDITVAARTVCRSTGCPCLDLTKVLRGTASGWVQNRRGRAEWRNGAVRKMTAGLQVWIEKSKLELFSMDPLFLSTTLPVCCQKFPNACLF